MARLCVISFDPWYSSVVLAAAVMITMNASEIPISFTYDRDAFWAHDVMQFLGMIAMRYSMFSIYSIVSQFMSFANVRYLPT